MEIIIFFTSVIVLLLCMYLYTKITKLQIKPKCITLDVVKMTEESEPIIKFEPKVKQEAYYKEEGLYYLTTWLKYKEGDLPKEIFNGLYQGGGCYFIRYTETPYENIIIGNAEFIRENKEIEYQKAMDYLTVEIPKIEAKKAEIQKNLSEFSK